MTIAIIIILSPFVAMLAGISVADLAPKPNPSASQDV